MAVKPAASAVLEAIVLTVMLERTVTISLSRAVKRGLVLGLKNHSGIDTKALDGAETEDI